MFRLRTAFATLALIVGLGSTSQAQMFNQGFVGFGMNGIQGGFGGFQPGYGGFQMGFGVPQVGGVGGLGLMGPALPYGYGSGYGYGYGVPYHPPYGYFPVPQTYNTMGSLIDSIETSTSRPGGWRRLPR